jgi:hypothetical protein
MPAARKTDPRTSHEAAESVIEVSDTQYKIWSLLRKNLTDEELVVAFRGRGWSGTDSGIRSRRKDLVDLGVVVVKNYATTRAGRRCIVWGRDA